MLLLKIGLERGEERSHRHSGEDERGSAPAGSSQAGQAVGGHHRQHRPGESERRESLSSEDRRRWRSWLPARHQRRHPADRDRPADCGTRPGRPHPNRRGWRQRVRQAQVGEPGSATRWRLPEPTVPNRRTPPGGDPILQRSPATGSLPPVRGRAIRSAAATSTAIDTATGPTRRRARIRGRAALLTALAAQWLRRSPASSRRSAVPIARQCRRRGESRSHRLLQRWCPNRAGRERTPPLPRSWRRPGR